MFGMLPTLIASVYELKEYILIYTENYWHNSRSISPVMNFELSVFGLTLLNIFCLSWFTYYKNSYLINSSPID
jgi:hypothetical protein